jgi:hypothetical protein
MKRKRGPRRQVGGWFLPACLVVLAAAGCGPASDESAPRTTTTNPLVERTALRGSFVLGLTVSPGLPVPGREATFTLFVVKESRSFPGATARLTLPGPEGTAAATSVPLSETAPGRYTGKIVMPDSGGDVTVRAEVTAAGQSGSAEFIVPVDAAAQ